MSPVDLSPGRGHRAEPRWTLLARSLVRRSGGVDRMDEAGRDSSGISGAALGGHRDRIGGHVLESGLDLETSARNLGELPGREDPDPRLRVLSRVEGASGSCPGPPAVQPARHGRVSGG
ncbi:MAG: hypothetical protein ACX98W_14845, partial [bacterium]